MCPDGQISLLELETGHESVRRLIAEAQRHGCADAEEMETLKIGMAYLESPLRIGKSWSRA